MDQEIAVFQVGTFTQGSFVSPTCSKRYDTMAKACWDCQRALLERILPLVKPPDEFVITLIWPSHFPVRLVIGWAMGVFNAFCMHGGRGPFS